ncbi:MAG: hypothetical protein ACE5J2_08130 [Nitrososphaerales archaeon]
MIKLETGVALGAFALHALFVAYMASFYIALSKPFEVTGILLTYQSLLVGVFISGIPGFGLAIVAYILSKRSLSRIVSMILIAQGVLMPAGMAYASMLSNNINPEYKSFELLITPLIFLVAGFLMIGLGVHLSRLKPIKRRTM